MSPCWFFIRGGECRKLIIPCTIQGHFWRAWQGQMQHMWGGQAIESGFPKRWGEDLPQYCLSAGLLVLMQDVAFLFRCSILDRLNTSDSLGSSRLESKISMDLSADINLRVDSFLRLKKSILVLLSNPFFLLLIVTFSQVRLCTLLFLFSLCCIPRLSERAYNSAWRASAASSLVCPCASRGCPIPQKHWIENWLLIPMWCNYSLSILRLLRLGN